MLLLCSCIYMGQSACILWWWELSKFDVWSSCYIPNFSRTLTQVPSRHNHRSWAISPALVTHFEVHKKMQAIYTLRTTKELKVLPLKNTSVSLLVLCYLAGISMFLSLISSKMAVSFSLKSCIHVKNSSIINVLIFYVYHQKQTNKPTNPPPKPKTTLTTRKKKLWKTKTHWFFSQTIPYSIK